MENKPLRIDINSLTKLYYSISEVANMFDVSKSLIRYWETEFPTLKPAKSSKGDRRFTKQNIEHIQDIYILVKEKGFTLDGARQELRHNKKAAQGKNELITKLENLKQGMLSLKDRLKTEG